MIADSYRGKNGIELSSLAWLLTHHKAKEPQRRHMVSELGLSPGDLVLDSGCGPGLWTALLAEQVAPRGRVVGIDFDPVLIKFAARSLLHHHAHRAPTFNLASFDHIPFKDRTFDAVLIGNCFYYSPNPVKTLLEQRRVSKRGGRVIGRHADDSNLIFSPIDPHLLLRVLQAAARALTSKRSPVYDNSFGRKMHGCFLQVGFEQVTTRTYAIQLMAPLQPEAKKYLTGKALWFARIAEPYLSSEDLKEWSAYFDPPSETFVLDRDNFFFCTLEMLTIGHV